MASVITVIVSSLVLVYIVHSLYTLSTLFATPQCSESPCFFSFLETRPQMQLALFVSPKSSPASASDVVQLYTFRPFNYRQVEERNLEVTIPPSTRKNGTLFMHVVLATDDGVDVTWSTLKRDGPTVIQRVALTSYSIPKAATFNLIGDSKAKNKNNDGSSKSDSTSTRPVTHFKSKISLSVMTDLFEMGARDIPQDLAHLVRVNRKNEFMPILQYNFMESRLADLEEITPTTSTMPLLVTYKPISVGKLRFVVQIGEGIKSIGKLGFTKKDIDDMKGALSDTNLYLLCGTMIIGTVHLLFDFLSFKNDISFWRQKKTYAGLSMRTTLWRGFSHTVVVLYLLDESTSMLVLGPAIIGTCIELWKCKKILKLDITWTSIRFRTNASENVDGEQERITKEIDREAMRYLTYLLYPLCIGGAIYSLIYQPHKSWYSWTINSLVNGVYAFGFLFMLPQLFINYKLKSVAALPWRSFMYKAFNTFIDDIFAFIITMPTAHRLACFRDDVIFVIYLYQRWLYPVDKNRLDDGDKVIERADNEGMAAAMEGEKKKTK